MGFDVQRVIAAYQQGRQIKEQKEKKVRDSEDRDFELKQRAAQLKMDTIQQQILKRKLEQENVGAMQGQSGEEITIPGFSAAPTPGETIDQGPGMLPLQSASIPGANTPPTVKDLPLPSMNVSGVEGLGVGGYTAQPKSMQELLRQARGEKAFESGLKKEENTVTLPASLLGGAPNDPPISVDKTIADNLISGVQQDARQDDQQAFTQSQAAAKAKDDAEQSRLDRASREGISAADNTAAQARSDQQAAARIAAAKVAAGSGELTARQTSTAISLANSLKGQPNYTDMLDVANGIQSVSTGLSQKNGLGDIMAINGFQKMVDPGATVREGDVSLIRSASGLLNKILSDYPIESLQAGAQLPPATRAAMAAAAKQLYDRRAKNYDTTTGVQYKGLAKAAGIPFEYIGTDFTSGSNGNPYR